MTACQFFTDEDVYAAVSAALRRAGYDALSSVESHRLGHSDESQLAWSADSGRVLITFNTAHFSSLHRQWLRTNRHHAGVIVSRQNSVRDVVRRLLHLARTLEADEMRDRLEFLGDW